MNGSQWRASPRLLAGKRSIVLAVVLVFLAVTLACGGLTMLPLEDGSGQPGGAAPTTVPAQPIGTLLPPIEEEEAVELLPGQPGEVIGQETQVGDVRWTILQAAELGQVLESGSETVPDLGAAGRLIGVRFELENVGQDPLTFLGMTIIDDQKQEYTYLGDALPFIVSEEACEVEDLAPAEAITCTAIYDVPEDASGLQAILTDLNLLGADQVPVDLGLD